MNISVVILTHNRDKDCAEAIESCLNQGLKPLEIIVVDDQSSIPFEYYRLENYPKIEIIRTETELGSAAARNLGIKQAKGNIVAFIDDDCIANHDWIKTIRQVFEETNADIAGGRVLPIYSSSLPEWWNDKFDVFISVHSSPQELHPNFFLCNMAVRKRLFSKLGYFNEKLGRKGGLLISNEETEFIDRAAENGGNIVFSEKMKVWHKANPSRMSMVFLFKRAWFQGVSNRLQYPIGLKLFLRMIGGMISCIVRIMFSPKHARYNALLLLQKLGYLVALFRY